MKLILHFNVGTWLSQPQILECT